MKKALFLIPIVVMALLGLYFFATSSPEEIRAGAVDVEDEVVDERVASVRGRVLTPTGSVIAGAQVAANDVEVETDDEGEFAFYDLEPGDYKLDASAPGHVRPGPPGVGVVEVTVVDANAGGLKNVDLVLPEPSRISGRVVASGQPVPGARISLYYMFAEGLNGRSLEPFALGNSGESGPDGAFSLDEVAPGRLRLLVETKEYALAESQEIYLRHGADRANLVIELAGSGELAGVVVTAAGVEIRAELVLAGDGLGSSRRVRADARGRFSFTNIPPGEFQLQAQATGFRPETLTDIVIEEGDVHHRDVILTPAAGIFGRVIDPRGDPAHGAMVVLTAPAGHTQVLRTTNEGVFQWDAAPDERWSAVAVTPFNATSPSQAVRSGTELVLRVGDGGRISGKVVDGRGFAVESYAIAVESMELDMPRPYSNRSIPTHQVMRADGVFEFGPLRPGTYRLRVEAPGHAPGTSERVVVGPGATVRGVVIRLGEGSTVAGVVSSAQSGEPVAGAEVVLFEPLSPFPANTTRTDAQGKFSISGVPSGRRSLRVSHQQYLTELASGVQVPHGSSVRRDVSLARKKPGESYSFHGIGAVLEPGESGVRVRSLMDGGPGQTFGLQTGDVIRAVDRESTDQLELQRIVELIRGEEGAPVSLEIEREGEGVFTLDLERGRVVVKGR